MITLKLTPSEFSAMHQFVYAAILDQYSLPLADQPVAMLVLIDYMESLRASQLNNWSRRKGGKEYAVALKPVVVKTLHDEMTGTLLFGLQQNVLNKLDLAIVDYRRSGMPLLAY